MPALTIPFEVWCWLASLGGATVSLAHLKKYDTKRKFGAVGAGWVTGGFLGPVVAEYFNSTARGTLGIHFFVGLGGLAITGAAMKLIQIVQNNPRKTAIEILKRLGGPPTKNGG